MTQPFLVGLNRERRDLARRIVWFAAAMGLKRGVGPFPFLMGAALRGDRGDKFRKALEGLDQAAEVLA